MAGRSTTAPFNVAAEAAAKAAAAAAPKTIGLTTVLAIAALVGGAATVGIFAGSQLGMFESTPAETAKTGPPSAAASLYGPGDTLSRADAIAKAQQQAQDLLAAVEVRGGGQGAKIVALINAANAASSRAASEVFLNLALDLNPDAATAARLKAALGSRVKLRAGAGPTTLGGEFFLDHEGASELYPLADVGEASGASKDGSGSFSAILADAAKGKRAGSGVVLDSADPDDGGGPSGAAPAGIVKKGTDDGDSGGDLGPGAGPAPTPIAIATPASSTL